MRDVSICTRNQKFSLEPFSKGSRGSRGQSPIVALRRARKPQKEHATERALLKMKKRRKGRSNQPGGLLRRGGTRMRGSPHLKILTYFPRLQSKQNNLTNRFGTCTSTHTSAAFIDHFCHKISPKPKKSLIVILVFNGCTLSYFRCKNTKTLGNSSANQD